MIVIVLALFVFALIAVFWVDILLMFRCAQMDKTDGARARSEKCGWVAVAKERARWAARSNNLRAASQAPTLAAAPSQGDPQCHNAHTSLFHCKGLFQNIRLAGWDAVKEVDSDSLQWIAIRRGPVLVPGS